MQTKKFIAGCLLISLVMVVGVALIFIFGDTLITNSLRTLALENPSILQGAELITNYGNYLYYILFICLFIYGTVKREKRYRKIGFIYLGVQIIASIVITELLKISIGRPRPGYGYAHHFFSGRSIFKSFPSGHTADAFSSAGVMWGFLSSYVLSFLSFFFSFLVGLSRIFVGEHYFLDVLAGMALGFITGIIVSFKKL